MAEFIIMTIFAFFLSFAKLISVIFFLQNFSLSWKWFFW